MSSRYTAAVAQFADSQGKGRQFQSCIFHHKNATGVEGKGKSPHKNHFPCKSLLLMSAKHGFECGSKSDGQILRHVKSKLFCKLSKILSLAWLSRISFGSMETKENRYSKAFYVMVLIFSNIHYYFL